MTDQLARAEKAPVPDYSETLFLPKTEFPMRAGLPQREPLLLQRWSEIDLYGRLRGAAAGRTRFVLHDGPPYANGNIHIGHALNKILKDLVTRSHGMLGFDSAETLVARMQQDAHEARELLANALEPNSLIG